MNTRAATLALAACLTLALMAGRGIAEQPTSLRIGTSSSGSIYYTLAVGLGAMLSRHAAISATAEPVGGSSANMFALEADKVDLAITNSGAAYDAFHAVAPFKKPVAIGLIAQGQPSYRQLIVRVGSGIEKPEDLVGKTIIGKRPALPEVELITNALLKVYNIDPAQVKLVSTTNTPEAVNALKSDTVDAVMIPASKGASYLQSLSQEGKIRFLDIPADKIRAMQQLLPPSFSVGQLPPETYGGQSKPVNVFSLSTYLVAAARLPEDTVYRVTRAFFDNIDEFHEFHAEAKDWSLAESLTDPKVPYHPGAIRYFKEKGVWSPELESLQAQFKPN